MATESVNALQIKVEQEDTNEEILIKNDIQVTIEEVLLAPKADITEPLFNKDVIVDIKTEPIVSELSMEEAEDDSDFSDTLEVNLGDDPSVITEELKNIFALGPNTDTDLICVMCNNGKKMNQKQLIKHYKKHTKMMLDLKKESNNKLVINEFYCHLCNDSKIMTRNELKEHYEGYHSMAITNKKQFYRRARSKHPRTPRPEVFKCEICMEIFTAKIYLDLHIEEHEDQYICDACQEGFKKLIDYILHLQIHSKDKLYKCLLCEFATNKRHLVKSHLYSVHEKFKKYNCDICNKGFSIFTHFEEHKYFHTGEKPFQCDVCGQKFMYTRYLNSHKVQMHKNGQKGIECKICNKVYAHRNSLNTHMRSHTGEVSVCDVCGKTLSSNEKLRLHYRIHTGEKPYKCDYCDKSFKTGTYRAEHERIHTGVKPYECPHCGKGFSQRTSMVIHSRGHTGEKPYVCHLCNKGFAARAMVTIHLKSCKGTPIKEETSKC